MNGTIIIVGGGTMGASIARLFASHDWSVQVVEPDADTRARLARDLASVSLEASPDAAGMADIALECVPEDPVLKRRVMRDLESRVPPGAAILSNTSGLSLEEISADMDNPERAAIAHFFNPGDMVPAVEVVMAAGAPEALAETVMDLLRALGKRPARLSRGVPGFVANRVQHAIMRECLHLADTGVATPEDIDEIVRWSIGIRLAALGPFRQRDLNGLDTHLRIARYLYPDLANATTPSPTLEAHVAAGRLGKRSGRGFFDWSGDDADRSDDATLRAVLDAVRAAERGTGT